MATWLQLKMYVWCDKDFTRPTLDNKGKKIKIDNLNVNQESYFRDIVTIAGNMYIQKTWVWTLSFVMLKNSQTYI